VAFPDRVAIASRNEHKLRELGRICADWPVTWITVENHDPSTFPEVEETGDTYLENAMLKARAISEALGVPALAVRAPRGTRGRTPPTSRTSRP